MILLKWVYCYVVKVNSLTFVIQGVSPASDCALPLACISPLRISKKVLAMELIAYQYTKIALAIGPTPASWKKCMDGAI